MAEEGFGRIVANLDFEEQLRVEAGLHPETLPATVRRALIRSAVQLAAFARHSEDRLLLPHLLRDDPAETLEAAQQHLDALPPHLPRPHLEVGPLEDLEPADRLLAWGETEAVASARRRAPPRPALDPDELTALPLRDLLWHLEPPDPAIAARVHHRSFHLHLARELGHSLPTSTWIDTLSDLATHLRTLRHNHPPPPSDRWVLKAPFSAAGRGRLFGTLNSDPGGKAGERVHRFLERHRGALFEPWVERMSDHGALAVIDPRLPDGWRYLGHHRLRTRPDGQFLGVELAGGGEGDEVPAEALRETTGAVVRRLQQEGYRGPVGIDAYRWRDTEGRVRLQALGEVNCRLTFGFVRRALNGSRE